MKQKIEEKIKELLDMLFIEETKYKVNVAQSSTVSNTVPDIRSSPEYSAVNIVGKEAITKLLYTLIQAERKDAVIGFVKWQFNEDNPIKMQRWNIIGFSLEDMLDEVEEYLESEGK